MNFKILRFSFLFLTSWYCINSASGQNTDTLHAPPDTAQKSRFFKSSSTPKKHSPAKAALMSAILPGLGQIYNKKYWKLPIVYTVLGSGIYFVAYTTQQYQGWKTAYTYRIDEDPETVDDFPTMSTQGLEQQTLEARKLLEISYLATTVIYVLNIIDASVDAHLFYFDVSDDLSMNIQPMINYSGRNVLTTGLSLRLKL